MTVLYQISTQKVLGHFDPQYLVNGKLGALTADIVELAVVEAVAPTYDISIEDITMEWVADLVGETYTQTWTVTAKTEQEKIDYINSIADMEESNIDTAQLKLAIRKVLENETDVALLDYVSMYPPWRVLEALSIDDKRKYKDELYKVIQAHTTQLDWPPDIVPALFVKIVPEGTIAPWEQPISTNPYQIGDKVTHNGSTWESTAANNVWEPGVYGWIKI